MSEAVAVTIAAVGGLVVGAVVVGLLFGRHRNISILFRLDAEDLRLGHPHHHELGPADPQQERQKRHQGDNPHLDQ